LLRPTEIARVKDRVAHMHENRCLVCGYDGDAEFYPRDYMICGCCGTEFGYDDRVLSHADLRLRWVDSGCPWFDEDEPKPLNWDPYEQLRKAGFMDFLTLIQAVEATSAAPQRTVWAVPLGFNEIGFQSAA
jgi:hypothetical protein